MKNISESCGSQNTKGSIKRMILEWARMIEYPNHWLDAQKLMGSVEWVRMVWNPS